MSKAPQYQCDACGQTFSKWSGQCPECHAWNTLEEIRSIQVGGKTKPLANRKSTQVTPLSDIDTAQQPRLYTQLDELDRVLGGGIVNGSVVLLGGSPGIGKSTLLIQMLACVN
jgi:DNA repair protein RadA/Sms